jgi:hypothetical protein
MREESGEEKDMRGFAGERFGVCWNLSGELYLGRFV